MEKPNVEKLPKKMPEENEGEAKYAELRERSFRIFSAMDGYPSRYFDSFYTRIGSPLGNSTMSNTLLAAHQFLFALAMSNHSEVEKIVRGRKEEFDPEPLRKEAVLQGMKILDLGCGPAPTFARSARRLGADVYTVDVLPADKFELMNITPESLDQIKKEESAEFFQKRSQLMEEFDETKRIDKEKHIQVDLNDSRAIEIIKERSGGQFDLITEAHLYSGSALHYGPEIKTPSYDLRDKIKVLLKKEGIFFSSN